ALPPSPAAFHGPARTFGGFDESGERLPGAEGEAESGEERARLVVGVARRAERDVHAPNGVDAVVVDLGDAQLLGDTEGGVSLAVERARRQAPEVSDPGDGDAHQ